MIEITKESGVKSLEPSVDTSLMVMTQVPSKNDERTTFMSVHNITSVEYSRWSKLNDTTDSRNMTIKTENGDRVVVTLFRSR